MLLCAIVRDEPHDGVFPDNFLGRLRGARELRKLNTNKSAAAHAAK